MSYLTAPLLITYGHTTHCCYTTLLLRYAQFTSCSFPSLCRPSAQLLKIGGMTSPFPYLIKTHAPAMCAASASGCFRLLTCTPLCTFVYYFHNLRRSVVVAALFYPTVQIIDHFLPCHSAIASGASPLWAYQLQLSVCYALAGLTC